MSKTLRLVTLVLLFLLAIAFSLKQLIEPDLWWQLRTGEWMLQTRSIPHADSFSFTYTNAPWQNIKWGYELLIAGLSYTLGVEMLMILQVVCSCVLVFLLLKLTKVLSPQTPQSIAYLITGLSLIAIEYRISGRSESISQLLFVLILYILMLHRNNPTLHIWWIPFVMMCWGNLHEAYGMGLVVLLLFAATTWLEALYTKTQTKQQALTYSKILAVSLVALCANPYHIHILLKPLEVANQVYQNKYTSELSTFTQALFWTKEAWIFLTLLTITLILAGIRFWVDKSKLPAWTRLNNIVPLPYAFLMLVLVYIASTGHRNIVFATLACVPLCIVNIAQLISFRKIKLNDALIYGITVFAFAFLYVSIVTNHYYTFWNSKHKYGLEVPAESTPIGAANFLETHNLLQKPVFSDYLSSSYLLWRLQPSFKTFIDLRDLEVFPVEHFNLFTQILANPRAFEKADSQYHFESVVLLTLPQMQTLHAHLYHHPSFRLVYVDALSCVYVKDTALIPVQAYSSLSTRVPSKWAYYLSKCLNPWYVPNNLLTLDQAYPAAEYFYSVNDWNLTRQYAQTSISHGTQPCKGLVLLAQVAYQQALSDTTLQRLLRMDSAAAYLQQALSSNPEYVPALLDMGIVSFQNQQYKSALNYLEKACDLDPLNLQAHTAAAEVYKAMAGTNNTRAPLEKAIHHFLKAASVNPNNPEIILNLGFLYYRLNDCDKATPYLEQIVDYENITELQRSRAREALQKCN